MYLPTDEWREFPPRKSPPQGGFFVRHRDLLWLLGGTAFVVAGCLFISQCPAARGVCRASWYGFESGRRTANGERFRPNGFSIALPFRPRGERYRVSYRGRSIIVRHNDLGPARWTHRCADLSYGAARALGFVGAGTALISLERID